jgi:hypothetical protein
MRKYARAKGFIELCGMGITRIFSSSSSVAEDENGVDSEMFLTFLHCRNNFGVININFVCCSKRVIFIKNQRLEYCISNPNKLNFRDIYSQAQSSQLPR